MNTKESGGATWNDCATFLYYFSKHSFVVKHFGKNEIPTFFSKIRFFFLNPIFFLEKFTKFSVRTLSIKIYYFSKKKIRNRVYGSGSHTTFRHFCVRSVKIAKCFTASSFMPRVTYVQYLTPCGVTTGSVTRLSSILLERQQHDVRSSIWLYYKAPDVPVNTMTAPSSRGRRMHITLQFRDRDWKWKAEKRDQVA